MSCSSSIEFAHFLPLIFSKDFQADASSLLSRNQWGLSSIKQDKSAKAIEGVQHRRIKVLKANRALMDMAKDMPKLSASVLATAKVPFSANGATSERKMYEVGTPNPVPIPASSLADIRASKVSDQ